MKILTLILFLMCFVCKTVYAFSLESVVIDCLNDIKKGNYEDSYSFFSLNLKKEISLEDHMSNLESIERNTGHLISFSKGAPSNMNRSIYKNYFIDENMFKNISFFKKEKDYKYILNYEKGKLFLHAQIEKEGKKYKIKIFNLQLISE
jgi:hypothetical protein